LRASARLLIGVAEGHSFTTRSSCQKATAARKELLS
jgi:hypothetical protein